MRTFFLSSLLTILASGLFQPAFGFSLAEADFKWDKKSVTVCWGNIEDLSQIKNAKKFLVKKIKNFQLQVINPKTQSAIQIKIQEQFKLENIGLEFIGWKSCAETPAFDIVLAAYEPSNYEYNEIDFLKEELPFGKANVAMAASNDSNFEKKVLRAPKEKGFVFIRRSSDRNLRYPENHFLMTALHEFGHAAGLLHEHLQVGALKDPLCLKYYKMESLNQLLEKQVAGQAYGAYDPESVMNYCNLFSFQQDWTRADSLVQLSTGDTHTLRCLYHSTLEPTGSCEPHQIEMKTNTQ